MTSFANRSRWLSTLLVGLCSLAPIGTALAWQVQPSPQAQFQQVVQQQQVSDQLQKSQMQQQLQQGVSDTAKRPLAADSPLRKQTDNADQARRDRERASQQDAVQRYQNSASTRAQPTLVTPSSTHGGH